MLNLSTILLPVDFSERSTAAARYAGALACRFQSQVIMLHVLPNEYPIGGFEAPIIDYGTLWKARLEEARTKLDAFLADDFRRMPVRRFVLEGDPATRIVQIAHSRGAKLIVMPTHGYGPFRRFILGSVTAKVLHDADCAVLTSAHLEEAPPESLAFRNILCAVDLRTQSRAALAWAAEFAAKYESRLHVIHALPYPEVGRARFFDAELRAALHRSAKEEVEAFLESANQHADVLIEHGAVAEAVRAAAKSVKADCVVIGRHESSGLLGRLHTNAYAIVRESPCPVVSV